MGVSNKNLAFLMCKMICGNIGGKNLIATVKYYYDENTMEYRHMDQSYDGGEEADKDGYYTFESVRKYIETKGKSDLVEITDGRLS